MKESTLINIALNTTLIGILILLTIAENTTVNSSLIQNITEEDEYVNVQGLITSSIETPGLYILTIEDNSGKIKVVAFKRDENITLQKNNIIQVEGTTTYYKEELEIIADKITKLSY
tara:strand:- start:311 stop:661 length:351 start_codon:yes stop_codon:yes gene_type:complete